MLTMLFPMRMVESIRSYSLAMESVRAARVSPASALLRRRILFRLENAVSVAEK